MDRKELLTRIAAAIAAAMFGSTSHAATYALDFQNVTFAISGLDSNTFTLKIFNADDAGSDRDGVNYLRAFSFKDISDGFSSAAATGTLDFGTRGPHLKVNFDEDTSGKKIGSKLSASIPQVPLPGTLGLLGSGLAGLGLIQRKRSE